MSNAFHKSLAEMTIFTLKLFDSTTILPVLKYGKVENNTTK
jgi:hypothetical protein